MRVRDRLLNRAAQVVLILALIACNRWEPLQPAVMGAQPTSALPTAAPLQAATQTLPVATSTPSVETGAVLVNQSETGPEPEVAPQEALVEPSPGPDLGVQNAEPAGCFSWEQQQALGVTDMLAYADSLLSFHRPLLSRRLEKVWNGYTRVDSAGGALALDVSDAQNLYLVQDMLNALHVAGFVAWLRNGMSPPGLQILAIPLQGEIAPEWAPYIISYWQGRDTLPDGDETVIPALKLPPCDWMVQQGYTHAVGEAWWPPERAQIPDYAQAADSYQAANALESSKIAQRINWLGSDGLEDASTMCGPLSWAILKDARAFPPGYGGWMQGPIAFWLSDPVHNGRPWSLFPRGDYSVYHFSQPLGKFDFQQWPLYPGDFLYTYSQDDGFDHMLVVTETGADGNVYTITNLLETYPVKKVTIERAVFYNQNDLNIGLARNNWSTDGKNGRTGQAGFDVFRWAWMEKNIQQTPVLYVVRPGDSFGLLAERWKTPARQIAEFNLRRLEDRLVIGEMLVIPVVPLPESNP